MQAMLHAVTSTAEKVERTRLSADDWEQGALDLIAAQGVGAVTVESLAKQLGVTKGSFYWHFPTREALLKAAFDRWEKQSTDKFIEEVAPIADPRARLKNFSAAPAMARSRTRSTRRCCARSITRWCSR